MIKEAVSLIMPAYNCASTLAAAISSILVQKGADFELIIIDDASTDDTLVIAGTYASKDTRVKILSQNENRGAAAAMNVGIRNARYDWIAIVDSDAVEPESWIKTALLAIQEHQELKVLGGRYQHPAPTKQAGSMQHVYYYAEAQLYPRSDVMSDHSNPQEPPIAGGNFFFTKEVYNTIGPFEESIRAGYDRLFLTAALESGYKVLYSKDLYVNHPLYDYTSFSRFIQRSTNFARWRNVIFTHYSLPSLERPFEAACSILALAVSLFIGSLLLVPNPAAFLLISTMIIIFGFAIRICFVKQIPWQYRVLFILADVVKKMITLSIYFFDLRPKKLDWKKR